jgi:hypothetical protein
LLVARGQKNLHSALYSDRFDLLQVVGLSFRLEFFGWITVSIDPEHAIEPYRAPLSKLSSARAHYFPCSRGSSAGTQIEYEYRST